MGDPPDSQRGDDRLIADHIAWVEAAVGDQVVAHDHLLGGISSTVLHCRFAARDDSLVLRVIDDQGLLRREPDVIDREAEALRILATSPVGPRTPELVAAEYRPEVGRVLMTRLDGRIVIDRVGLGQRIDELAAIAADIAATPLPDGHRLGGWWSWVRPVPAPPAWGDEGLWTEALDVHRCGPPAVVHDRAPVLLHRDFHPLNILWPSGRAASPAVVDWVNACVGHPHAELGHCRWNLAVTVGLEAADRFLDRYLAATADRGVGPYDRWWDIDSLLDKVPGPITTTAWLAVGRHDMTDEHVTSTTDAFLRSVLTD